MAWNVTARHRRNAAPRPTTRRSGAPSASVRTARAEAEVRSSQNGATRSAGRGAAAAAGSRTPPTLREREEAVRAHAHAGERAAVEREREAELERRGRPRRRRPSSSSAPRARCPPMRSAGRRTGRCRPSGSRTRRVRRVRAPPAGSRHRPRPWPRARAASGAWVANASSGSGALQSSVPWRCWRSSARAWSRPPVERGRERIGRDREPRRFERGARRDVRQCAGVAELVAGAHREPVVREGREPDDLEALAAARCAGSRPAPAARPRSSPR